MTKTSALILSPHFDDAVLSCWTVLRERADPFVATVFSGPPPDGTTTRWDRIAGARDSAALVRERAREDAAVMRKLGVAHRSLGFLENQYRPGAEGITGLGKGAPTSKEVHRALSDLEADAVYAPAGLGGHADHILMRTLALELARNGADVWLYADIPYAAIYGWPDWVTDSRPTEHLDANEDWLHYLRGLEAWNLAPRVVPLSDAKRRQKLADVEGYKTQFPSLNGGRTERLRHPHTLSFEVFWSVKPAT